MTKYVDRCQAGYILAQQLNQFAHDPRVLVLALPRGGVPVAYEVAKHLSVPLDVWIVRKLGVPGHEELAFGAIASGGTIVFNDAILKDLHITTADIESVSRAEQQELQRREKKYRINLPPPVIKDKIIILIDDGIATGATMRAAIQSIRQQHPARLVLAVPVAQRSTYDEMRLLVDTCVCPLTPEKLCAVGAWYDSFEQTADEEVHDLLALTARP